MTVLQVQPGCQGAPQEQFPLTSLSLGASGAMSVPVMVCSDKLHNPEEQNEELSETPDLPPPFVKM